MLSRREVMKRSSALAALLAAPGLLPAWAQSAQWNKAAFDAKTPEEAYKALGLAKPVETRDVTLIGPDIAENGAVVPVGASTTLAGVKRLMIVIEKNPFPLAAMFELSDALEPAINTRVKMSQTSNVYAVALTADNKVLFAQKEIKVTLGGCGG
ncbi:MAG TPA: thiosulfate oxidation carrier protein SoxY [Burkholderiaceae bacterium]|jgi:sulfur-oxidizing protein SoxY|nr:thiosulfate oxidation carrier protein SoxY [Burkholderiaceae bacterium]